MASDAHKGRGLSDQGAGDNADAPAETVWSMGNEILPGEHDIRPEHIACGTPGTCSAPPEVLTHSLLPTTAWRQAEGCNGHPAFRTPS
jgi:hypothetical protein